MAAFTDMAEAEARAIAKMADFTWVVAHAEREFDATIAVRVQRPMSPTHPDYGAWIEVTDATGT
jgi:hypothetical protein